MPHNMNLLDSIVYEKRELLTEDINYAEKIMYTYIKNFEKMNMILLKIASNNKVLFFDQQSFQCDHEKKYVMLLHQKAIKFIGILDIIHLREPNI